MIKTFKYEPNYEDVVHLETYGYWPDNQVPTWAREVADFYGVTPRFNLVTIYAMKHEIERLRELVEKQEMVIRILDV